MDGPADPLRAHLRALIRNANAFRTTDSDSSLEAFERELGELAKLLEMPLMPPRQPPAKNG